ncbi:MAG: SCO family protein [Zoogloeaceae bacterium]|jgi:protein SCO1/2|nr:SCO family protein [Zoogloeaceae bacterium]
MKRVLAIGFLALLAACDTAEDAAEPNAAPVAVPSHAKEMQARYGEGYAMTDHLGQTRTLADWRGKVALVFFGYTHCPDACPSALYRFSQVMEILGPQAEQVQVLFVTLDPARDKPEILRDYTAAFNPNFLGLYVSPEKTPELARAFHVFYQVTPGQTPEHYSVDHGVGTYVYDTTGRLRLEIDHTATPDEVADSVRQLLAAKKD